MLRDVDLSGYEKVTAKNVPWEKFITSGHRACQGCAEVLAMGMVMKAAGPETIVCNATGCMEIITSPFPQSAWTVPWMHVAFENAAAVASGVESATRALERKGKLKKKPKIIAFAGDGGTADIGLQSLSGALERGHDFVYVCLDNEAYMNTGIQRSSSTPYGAMTTTTPPGRKSIGQHTWKKNMAMIAAAHEIPYVATATPAYHLDLFNKVKKALAVEGPAYLHIFATCPTGWRSDPAKSVELCRLAVQTKVFPLYEVVGGRYIITQKVKKPKPVTDYFKLQRRFRHLTPDAVEYIQNRVDEEYARLEAFETATAPLEEVNEPPKES
jgi:pyruvate ferredoxin oxidoreductase beta subunit